ncbi:MAG: hypothetical protein ACT4P1_15865 [Sporichthyaceae bacterium]
MTGASTRAAAVILTAGLLAACSTSDGTAPAAAPPPVSSVPSAPETGAPATTAAPARSLGPLEDAEPIPAGRTGAPRGGTIDPADVNGRSKNGADAVADAVAATFYRHDTRLDTSPADAPRRATPWLTATYAAALAAPRPGGGGAAWLELIDHDAYTSTKVRPVLESGAPPDTPQQAYRQRQVTVTAHGTNGWTQRETHVLFLALTRTGTGAPWKVNALTVA